jgi:L-aspartate oxidase
LNKDGGKGYSLVKMAHVLVVGSGIAGLFAALRCAEAKHQVSIITKSAPSDSSTNWAQGGIAGILDKTDDSGLEDHIEDTISAGAGHCDPRVVRLVCEEAGERITDLLNIGVRFERDSSGKLDMALEGGHSSSRIFHAKDTTGAEIERALMQAVDESEYIEMFSNHLAVDLVLKDSKASNKEVVGLWCLDGQSKMVTIAADAVMIATGGAGQLYRQTTNPEISTADGVAMSLRAGAAIRDMEFIQFHPTALTMEGDRPFLLTEAIRGQGAVLMTTEEYQNWDGQEDPSNLSFTLRYSESGSLATRDIVARACDSELKLSGEQHVLLVTEHLGAEVGNRFPMINLRLQRHGLSLGVDAIPVSPAAHYFVGGLRVDDDGLVQQESGLAMKGLYAIGEVACTGMHGANRLASNSLLEAVVYAHRASNHFIGSEFSSSHGELPTWRGDEMADLEEHSTLVHDRSALQSTMTDDVGLVKSDNRLQRALRRIQLLRDEVERVWMRCRPSKELVELRNMAQVSEQICRASISRKKNIGLHWNKDLI